MIRNGSLNVLATSSGGRGVRMANSEQVNSPKWR